VIRSRPHSGGDDADVSSRIVSLLICGIALVLVAGCTLASDDGKPEVGTSAGVGEIVGPVTTVAIASSGEVVYVVQGGGVSGEGSDPQIGVVDGTGLVAAHTVRAGGPLFDVSAWWTGAKVAIIGLPCPTWADTAETPDIFDFDEDGRLIAERCGNDSYIAGLWDPESATWDEVPLGGLRANDGVGVVDAVGPVAVLEAVSAGIDGAPRFERSVQLRQVDLRRGTLRDLPPPLSVGSSADASFTVCLDLAGAPEALLAWDGPEPPLVAEGAVSRDLVRVAPEGSEASASFVAFSEGGSGWAEKPLSGELTALGSAPVCAADGFVLASASRAVTVQRDGDEFRSDAVDDLPSSQGGTVVRRSADPSDGTVIAVATTRPPGSSPDDARPTPIFALSGDKWVEGHPVPFAEGWRGVVLQSGTVVSLVPRGPLGNVELDLA